MSMRRELVMGAAAGAIGTVALNITTYVDMAVRGRPSSEMPAETARRLADQAGISLSADGPDSQTAQSRRTAIGQLLGYVTGLGVGVLYSGVAGKLGPVPRPLHAVLLGAAAMAGSDVPATLLGIAKPADWPASSWAADIVPHLAYGVATAATYHAFTAS